MIRKDIATRVPLRLYTSTGAAATGIVPADFAGGLVRVVKANGTVQTIALGAGVNFFEVDATNAPGLYQVLLAAGNVDVVGPITLVWRPNAAAFIGGSSDHYVETMAAFVELTKKIQRNRWKIHTTGPDANRMVIYDDDGTTILLKFDLKNSAGAASTTAPFEKVPA